MKKIKEYTVITVPINKQVETISKAILKHQELHMLENQTRNFLHKYSGSINENLSIKKEIGVSPEGTSFIQAIIDNYNNTIGDDLKITVEEDEITEFIESLINKGTQQFYIKPLCKTSVSEDALRDVFDINTGITSTIIEQIAQTDENGIEVLVTPTKSEKIAKLFITGYVKYGEDYPLSIIYYDEKTEKLVILANDLSTDNKLQLVKETRWAISEYLGFDTNKPLFAFYKNRRKFLNNNVSGFEKEIKQVRDLDFTMFNTFNQTGAFVPNISSAEFEILVNNIDLEIETLSNDITSLQENNANAIIPKTKDELILVKKDIENQIALLNDKKELIENIENEVERNNLLLGLSALRAMAEAAAYFKEIFEIDNMYSFENLLNQVLSVYGYGDIINHDMLFGDLLF